MMTEKVILQYLLLGGLTIYLAIVAPFLEWRRKQRRANFKSTGIMQGLYYHLPSGVDMLICKDWLPETIACVARELARRSPKVRCMMDYDGFRQVCGEEFDAQNLFTKSIAANASIYPLYQYSRIIWEAPSK